MIYSGIRWPVSGLYPAGSLHLNLISGCCPPISVRHCVPASNQYPSSQSKFICQHQSHDWYLGRQHIFIQITDTRGINYCGKILFLSANLGFILCDYGVCLLRGKFYVFHIILCFSSHPRFLVLILHISHGSCCLWICPLSLIL